MKNVKFESHLDQVVKQIDSNFQAMAEEMKAEAIEWVQEKMLYGYHEPHGEDGHTEIYDTGKLIDTLDGEVKKASQNAYEVTVGSPQPYAVYVHNGTYKLHGRPFIRDGLEGNQDKIKEIFENNAKKGF